MVPVTSLWMPIVVSAVIVFVASSVIHMVLTYHRSDVKKVPKEDEVMAALRPFHLGPGDYVMPHAGSAAAMKDPVFVEKRNKGPVAFMTVMPSGPVSMGTSLVQWFLFSLVVSAVSGYIAFHGVGGSGAPYRSVFRFVGASAFLAYGIGQLPASIWYKRNWAMTIKGVVDGLVYALLTAGTFGWLWPR